MNSEEYKIHEKCRNTTVYYDKIIIKYYYDWKYISKMVKDAKFYHKKDILYDFWEELTEQLIQNCIDLEDSIIVPIPIHFFKRWKRGYNQCEILSEKIEEDLKIPYLKNILYKKKYTRQQSKLSKQKRLVNLQNSFDIRKKYVDIIDKKQIILVDDIVSTGSTLNEASKVLRLYWAKKVVCICVASN
jgi:competence protein ComFC